jgi:hypothetical protein
MKKQKKKPKTINKICQACKHPCKQSSDCIILQCPKSYKE